MTAEKVRMIGLKVLAVCFVFSPAGRQQTENQKPQDRQAARGQLREQKSGP